jgi:cbb3-type cytochrome oxidase subunit 3
MIHVVLRSLRIRRGAVEFIRSSSRSVVAAHGEPVEPERSSSAAHPSTGSGRAEALLRGGGVAFGLLLWLAITLTALPAAQAQSPTPPPAPPGTGGTVFGSVRVLSGNELARNPGQENQPPVWITIDTKGSTAVVTVGNATRNQMDFSGGGVAVGLAPGVQPSQVLVSTGSAVIQGNEVVWTGFGLSATQIQPALITLVPAAGPPPTTATTAAISNVTIEAKDPQTGARVSEQVAGGGPPVSAVKNVPLISGGSSVGSSAGAAAVTPRSGPAPLTAAAARTFGTWALALLAAMLLVLLLLTAFAYRASRRLNRLVERRPEATTSDLTADTATRLEEAVRSLEGVQTQLGAPTHVNRLLAAAATLEATARSLSAPAVNADQNGNPSTPASLSTGQRQPAQLEMEDGAEKGRRWPLEGENISVGRDQRNAIVLADPRVSNVHARLLLQPDGRYLLVDNGSTNGTTLNGRAVLEPAALHEGDRLRIGGTTFVFRDRVEGRVS